METTTHQQKMLKWFNDQHLTMLMPLLFILISLYTIVYKKSNKKIPPSPPKLPIVGNLHQISRYPHRSFYKMSQKYGDLMLLHFGQTPFLIVSSKEAAQQILKSHEVDFSDRPFIETADRLFYNSKDVGSSPYGEYWRKMRTICMSTLLNTKKVASFRSIREEEMLIMMDEIVKKSKNGSIPVDMSEILSTYSHNVICMIAFGKRYNSEGFRMLWDEFMELIIGFRVGDYIPCLGWTKRFDGWDKRIERVNQEFDRFLEQILADHQDDRKDNDDEVTSFLDALLRAQHEKDTTGISCDRDCVKAVMLDIFSGGMDTSTTLLEWAVAEVLKNPEVMRELKNEVREIVGLKSEVNEDDLIQMKYLKAVLKETLRLHPPLFFIARYSTKDVCINGYDIPKGTNVFINNWAIQRDNDYWDEADKFNPNRFINSSIDYLGNDFEYTPFGAGRRMCPGKSFAMALNEIVLANLVHKFDWIVPNECDKSLDMTERIGVTQRKKTHILAIPKLSTMPIAKT